MTCEIGKGDRNIRDKEVQRKVEHIFQPYSATLLLPYALEDVTRLYAVVNALRFRGGSFPGSS